MLPKVLVCYATRYGSTGEIADIICEELISMGFPVDISPISDVEDPLPYDVVVIGSPIYMGKWLVEARDFVHQFRDPLNKRFVAAFSVGYSLKDRLQVNLKSADAALDAVRLYIKPAFCGFFAGCVNPDPLSYADRAILTMTGVEPGDYRNWNEIREWARTLGNRIKSYAGRT